MRTRLGGGTTGLHHCIRGSELHSAQTPEQMNGLWCLLSAHPTNSQPFLVPTPHAWCAHTRLLKTACALSPAHPPTHTHTPPCSVTVLFADIQGFTEFARVCEPDQTFSILNKLFQSIEGFLKRWPNIYKVRGQHFPSNLGPPHTRVLLYQPPPSHRVDDTGKEMIPLGPPAQPSWSLVGPRLAH